MRRPGLVANLLLASSFALSETLSAQTSSIEGNVTGTDGRPLKTAEIRFEQRGRQISPIISRTDSGGHYAAALPKGLYKMSLAERGTVKASITVKATGKNSRIDFDLRPSAEKKIKHYVGSAGRRVAIFLATGLKPESERAHRLPLRRAPGISAVVCAVLSASP